MALEARAVPRLLAHPSSKTSHILDDNGQLWTWGDNTLGSLADGTQESRAQPRRVIAPGVTRWLTVSAGRRVLALDQQQRLWAWGAAQFGAVTRPVHIANPSNRWTAVASLPGLDSDLLLDAAGQVWLWRFIGRTPPTLPTPFAGGVLGPLGDPGAAAPWRTIAAGDGHGLLLSASGQVFAYGSNHLGQCGPSVSTNFTATPVPVPSPEPKLRWAEVACGAETSFGRLSNGEWYFWGATLVRGSNGVATVATPVPTRLLRPKEVATWRQVVGGRWFILLLSEDGRAYGLGDNSLGKLAYPWGSGWNVSFTAEPQRVFAVGPQTNRVLALAAGENHGLALDEDGELYTWGANGSGELGRAAAGSAWRPRRVHGDTPPFSPEEEPLPVLEWVAVQPKLISPLLAGQAGQAAEFEIRRRGGAEHWISITLEPTSEPNLPGLPLGYIEQLGLHYLAPSNSVLPIALTSLSSPLPAVAANLGLRAVGPPWVTWAGSNVIPFTVEFPQRWSQPPTSVVRIEGGPPLRLGQTNTVLVGCRDPDGWVTSVELFARCWGCGALERIGARSFRRGLADRTNWVAFPWVPSAPPFRTGSNTVSFITVLRDNAGSVVTNSQGFASLVGPPKFRVAWADPDPVIEVPGSAAVRIEQLQPAATVTSAELTLFGTDGKPLERYPVPEIPGQFAIPFPGLVSVSGRVRIWAGGEKEDFPLPFLTGMAKGNLPYLKLEAVERELGEDGDEHSAFRLTRYGGDLNRRLTVLLTTQTVRPEDLPVPRRDSAPAATPRIDYEGLPNQCIIPAGETTLTLPVRPLNDSAVEGNEGLSLAIRPFPGAYNVLPNQDRALVVIHDSDPPRLPTVVVRRSEPGFPQFFDQPLELSVQTTAVEGATITKLDVFADDHALGSRTNVPPPLPVGPMLVQARVTDSFGQTAWSEPLTVEVGSELRLLQWAPLPDGSARLRLEAQPLFQDLVLETSPDLSGWSPALPWRPTPTNRVQEITLPAEAVARFLRLVPAPEP